MNPYIVIIDDDLPSNDPLIFELEKKYGQFNVSLLRNYDEGLSYLLSHLEQRLIVLLDIRLSEKDSEKNGHALLQALRNKTELVPVVILSACNGKQDDFTDFVKNHAFDVIPKGSDPDEIIAVLEEARLATSTNIDIAIEQWLEKQDNKDATILMSKSGKSYTANQLIEEIRKQTDEGKRLVNNINKLTIDLLFRGKEEI
jgi:DNA-binding NtrC family response regulator